jgi:hypothetical protein
VVEHGRWLLRPRLQLREAAPALCGLAVALFGAAAALLGATAALFGATAALLRGAVALFGAIAALFRYTPLPKQGSRRPLWVSPRT